eukprot:TRINITY_DN3165_c0_g1_i1.p3 TRINITY_DN3165_c0_g1~~TRINITY_DN3165_c0_g1_i1.p3  ORF type:complete len:101 (-),score=5.29 TRINITY_DN3165_c0_g1_i1:63-365(-)
MNNYLGQPLLSKMSNVAYSAQHHIERSSLGSSVFGMSGTHHYMRSRKVPEKRSWNMSAAAAATAAAAAECCTAVLLTRPGCWMRCLCKPRARYLVGMLQL